VGGNADEIPQSLRVHQGLKDIGQGIERCHHRDSHHLFDHQGGSAPGNDNLHSLPLKLLGRRNRRLQDPGTDGDTHLIGVLLCHLLDDPLLIREGTDKTYLDFHLFRALLNEKAFFHAGLQSIHDLRIELDTGKPRDLPDR